MNSVYIHNLDPFALQFTETFGIRWYGLAYLSGFIAAFIMIHYMAKWNLIRLPVEKLSDFVTFGAVGVLAGGRLGYALFYDPQLFTTFHGEFPFWGVLEVNKGGMASHGGIAGVIIACWLFGKIHKISKLHLLDLTTMAAGLAFFFGRIANFINGELYGREVAETFRYAVKFPQELYRWSATAPEKLKALGPVVEALSPVQLPSGESISANTYQWNDWVTKQDSQSQQYIDFFISRTIDAVQKGNQKVVELLGPILTARHPSQLYQAVMEGLIVFIVLAIIWYKPRKIGVISAWFGITYALMRILGEQFRMPDAGIGFQALGLTRGQWLSVGLLAIAILLLIYSIRRPGPMLGGWGVVFKGNANKGKGKSKK